MAEAGGLSPVVRLRRHADDWRVVVGEISETVTSLIAYGRRDATPVVLKVVKRSGDEWHSGSVASAFDGSDLDARHPCLTLAEALRSRVEEMSRRHDG